MNPLLESLRLFSDPTRLRLLALLDAESLSVAELQEILVMKQSRISTQLAQLKQAGLVTARRSGKNSIYELGEAVTVGAEGKRLRDLLKLCASGLPETLEDRRSLLLAIQKRSDKVRQYFDQLAGKFGKTYVPGRSWKSLAETLLNLMNPMIIADLGAGEGTFSQLLAQRAQHVIAVDNSEAMVTYGSRIAKENGVENLEYRLGDIQSPPIEDSSVDIAFFSQALHHARKPATAVSEAYRICRPGGRIVILDLLKHDFEQARDLYQHESLGFSETEIYGFLENAGFRDLRIALVDKEADHPHFQTLMAIGVK